MTVETVLSLTVWMSAFTVFAVIVILEVVV